MVFWGKNVYRFEKSRNLFVLYNLSNFYIVLQKIINIFIGLELVKFVTLYLLFSLCFRQEYL